MSDDLNTTTASVNNLPPSERYPHASFPCVGGTRWTRDTFCQVFVRSPEGNFLFSGGRKVVKDHIKKHYPICLANLVFWHGHKPLSLWSANGICVLERRSLYGMKIARPAHAHFSVGFFASEGEKESWIGYFYRQLPKVWLPEWTALRNTLKAAGRIKYYLTDAEKYSIDQRLVDLGIKKRISDDLPAIKSFLG